MTLDTYGSSELNSNLAACVSHSHEGVKTVCPVTSVVGGRSRSYSPKSPTSSSDAIGSLSRSSVHSRTFSAFSYQTFLVSLGTYLLSHGYGFYDPETRLFQQLFARSVRKVPHYCGSMVTRQRKETVQRLHSRQ